MKIKNITIDGIQCNIALVPVFSRIKLDMKVARILAPFISGLGFSKMPNLDDLMNADIDSDTINLFIEAISTGLASLDENDAMSIITQILENTTCLAPGKPALVLNNANSIDQVFEDNHFSLYKLLFEALRFNKIVPFGLGVAGKSMSAMFTSTKQTSTVNQNGSELEVLEN